MTCALACVPPFFSVHPPPHPPTPARPPLSGVLGRAHRSSPRSTVAYRHPRAPLPLRGERSHLSRARARPLRPAPTRRGGAHHRRRPPPQRPLSHSARRGSSADGYARTRVLSPLTRTSGRPPPSASSGCSAVGRGRRGRPDPPTPPPPPPGAYPHRPTGHGPSAGPPVRRTVAAGAPTQTRWPAQRIPAEPRATDQTHPLHCLESGNRTAHRNVISAREFPTFTTGRFWSTVGWREGGRPRRPYRCVGRGLFGSRARP